MPISHRLAGPLATLACLLGPAAGAALADERPHALLRYWGEASSATGNAVGQGSCDVDGDGFADAVVGSWFWDKAPNSNVGAAYVIFGGDDRAGGDLSTPAAAGAARIDGPSVASAFAGFAVSCAGDVNGDGFDDIAISHYTAERAYVVLGAADFGSPDLSNLGERGFVIRGAEGGAANVGFSMAPAGDVDSDGLADFAIAGVVADTRGRTNNGRVWIVAGKEDVADVDLASPAPGEVLQTIDGPMSEARLGQIAPAGDVNGDGANDVVLGAYTATPHGAAVAVPGEAWVVFGGSPAALDLADLGGAGFAILGPERGRDRLGISVSAAGDLDGDGLGDVIVGGDGVYNAATGQRPGSAWVVRGSASTGTVRTDASGAPAVYDCPADPGGACDPGERRARGYWIRGEDTDPGTTSEGTGYAVSNLGDVNGDDVPDLAIGAFGYDPPDPASPGSRLAGAGATFVVFGRPGDATQDLAGLDPSDGYRLDGLAAGDRFGRQVARIGDFDGNGVGDLAIGADFAARPPAPATPRSQAGEVAVALLGSPATRTALSSDVPGDATPGEAIGLRATVTAPATGGPADGGTVAFTADGTVVAGCEAVSVDADGEARCDISFPRHGEHSLRASFSGGAQFAGSASAVLTQRVVDDSVTTLSGPARTAAGETVSLEAAVTAASSGDDAGSGTVSFSAGGEGLPGCDAVPVSGGAAGCEASLPPGDASVTAEYSGAGTLRGSRSAALAVRVEAAERAAGRLALGSPRVKLGRGGTAIGSIACEAGPCEVVADVRPLRVGKRRFAPGLEAPSSLASGAAGEVLLDPGRRARRALIRRGRGHLRVRVTLRGDGNPVEAERRFTLRMGAGK